MCVYIYIYKYIYICHFCVFSLRNKTEILRVSTGGGGGGLTQIQTEFRPNQVGGD